MESGSLEFATWIMAVATAIYTVGTLLLWRTTKNTATLIEKQISAQIQSNHILANHSSLDGHRSLFLEIIKNPEMLKLLSEETGLETSEARKKFLASLIINHVLRVFLDYKHNVALDYTTNSFDSDAADLFSFPFIRTRWDEVKKFHPAGFRNHIDNKIVPIVDGS